MIEINCKVERMWSITILFSDGPVNCYFKFMVINPTGDEWIDIIMSYN